MNLNGTEYYYIRNAQGDITGLFDESGTIVVEYVYDSWGKLISTTGSLASTVGEMNPYKYRGYRYDTETGLYYLQSRYYNPEWGRFVNADALGGEVGKLLSHNVFAYSLNNPVNMEDPSGYFPKWIEAIGTMVCGVVAITGAYAAGIAAITAGALIGAGTMAVIGVGVSVVGLAKTVAAASGAKNEVVDRINIKENVATTFLGEKNGKYVSSAIDVGMIVVPPALGIGRAILNPKRIINTGKTILKSAKGIKTIIKKPMTYMSSWDKYSAGATLVEGLHNLNLISDETYNKIIPIFDPK